MHNKTTHRLAMRRFCNLLMVDLIPKSMDGPYLAMRKDRQLVAYHLQRSYLF